LLFRVAKSEQNHVLGSHERPASFYVGEQRGPIAGRKRQVHRRRFTVRIDLGLIEVGMTVDEQETKASASLERQGRPEHDRAIPTEDDGKFSIPRDRLDGIGKARRPIGDGLRVQSLRCWIAFEGVRRRLDDSRAAPADALCQAMTE
jgi:hypothetical protein